MKRKALITSLFLAPFLFSCSAKVTPSGSSLSENTSEDSSLSENLFTLNLSDEFGLTPEEVSPNHGTTVLYHYLGERREAMMFPERQFKDVDFSSGLPGDVFVASFLSKTKEILVEDTNPGQYFMDVSKVIEAKIERCAIVEIDIHEGEITPKEGIDFSSLFSNMAINEKKEYVELSSITKGYATISKLNEGKARAIYTYNPRS